MRLTLHPDDPPLSPVMGVSRIFGKPENYDRAMAMIESEANAICFCQANFGLMDSPAQRARPDPPLRRPHRLRAFPRRARRRRKLRRDVPRRRPHRHVRLHAGLSRHRLRRPDPPRPRAGDGGRSEHAPRLRGARAAVRDSATCAACSKASTRCAPGEPMSGAKARRERRAMPLAPARRRAACASRRFGAGLQAYLFLLAAARWCWSGSPPIRCSTASGRASPAAASAGPARSSGSANFVRLLHDPVYRHRGHQLADADRRRGCDQARRRSRRRGAADAELPAARSRAGARLPALGGARPGRRTRLALAARRAIRRGECVAPRPRPRQRAGRLALRSADGDDLDRPRDRVAGAAFLHHDVRRRDDDHPAGAARGRRDRRRRRLGAVPQRHRALASPTSSPSP